MSKSAKEITKEQNLFNLYDQLGNSGEKGKAKKYISDVTGASYNTVYYNWFKIRELPIYIKEDESKMDKMINYLQKQIALQNEVLEN